MFAINFYEKEEDKIAKPLKTRKGICGNYALLFTDICNKAGVRSYVITGYTKQNGFADYIPHAWSAAVVDSSWYIFDATWGSGYYSNGKFVRKIDNGYYKIKPQAILKSHMPFDYLWQFVNYPVTNQEFYEGKVQSNKTRAFFNYTDTLQAYEKLDRISQLNAEARRVQSNGVKNSMIFDRLQHVRYAIENENTNTYNTAASEYNDAINKYNDFINYRNKHFIPQKADVEIQGMIDVPKQKLSAARNRLAEIREPTSAIQGMIVQLEKGINDSNILVNEQQAWLNTYFSKGKIARKSMFYEKKVTVFGIPVN
jgi:hypothetical protein